MTPKLKHLADEAAKYAGIMALPTGRPSNELFVEKLVELMIEECKEAVRDFDQNEDIIRSINIHMDKDWIENYQTGRSGPVMGRVDLLHPSDEARMSGLEARVTALEMENLSKTLRAKNGGIANPSTPNNIKNYHCTVKGCTNNNIDGPFTGNLCNPCHEFITTGTGRFSQAFRNQKAAVAEAVADERERRAALLGEMHVKAGGLHNYYERAAKIVRGEV